jgi:Family of unknown function (DUF6069)
MATKPKASAVFQAALIAGFLAAMVNLFIHLIGKAAGITFEVSMDGKTTEIVAMQTLGSSVLALVFGALAVLVVARLRNADTIWVLIVGLVFILETGYAFAVASDVGTGIMLGLMHCVVVAAALWKLRGFLPRVQGSGSGEVPGLPATAEDGVESD